MHVIRYGPVISNPCQLFQIVYIYIYIYYIFFVFYFLENPEEPSSPNDLQFISSDVHPPSTIRCYIPEQHAGQGFVSLVLNPCFQYTNPPIMTHTIHVWYIYLHFVDFYGKCWQIYQSHGSYAWWCCNCKAFKNDLRHDFLICCCISHWTLSTIGFKFIPMDMKPGIL